MTPLRVCGRDQFVDAIHALVDGWMDDEAVLAAVGLDGLTVLRLAIHEWVANLMQHAEFCGAEELTVHAEVVEGGVRCTMEDTSTGFDFVNQIGAQQSMLEAPAPSERGRGLLMMVACADDLDFRPATDEARQRIAFTVRAPSEDVFATLFRPEDLALDADLAFELPDDADDWGDGASDLPTDLPSVPTETSPPQDS